MLDFYIAVDPKINDEHTWRHVGGMEYDEWEAFFYDALGAEPYVADDPEWPERAELKFKKVASVYPLLSRVGDYYSDAWYEPGEIEQLREEGLKAMASTPSRVAAKVLSEIVEACDEAAQQKWGLMMACD